MPVSVPLVIPRDTPAGSPYSPVPTVVPPLIRETNGPTWVPAGRSAPLELPALAENVWKRGRRLAAWQPLS